MRALAGAILGVWLVQAPQEPLRPVAGSADASDWLGAAAGHQPGVLNDADLRIAGWPEVRLLGVLRDVRQLPSSEALNESLLRGAMLHADIALRDRGEAPSLAGGWTSGGSTILAIDGRRVGTGALDPQVIFGRRVISAMRLPDPLPGRYASDPLERERERRWTEDHARDPRIRQWYRALAAHFARRYWLADLLPHLDAARERLPGDPGVLFDYACLCDALASPRVQAALPEPERASSPSKRPLTAELGRARLSRDFNLSEAEKQYRRVLEIQPSFDEARVRLARINRLRGRGADALALVRDPVRVNDPVVRYFGALIAGGLQEQAGDLEEAAASFGRASALFERAQTPHLALSRLRRARGDAAGAREAAARLAALPADRGDADDPWWNYHMCNGRNAGPEVQRLREMFAPR